ncbi:MAG: transglycosylase domain-containing protein [Acidimicrobiia bacterium]|nr:transglycosylase domain-containing protein [Acidimicrobiia bacterium]
MEARERRGRWFPALAGLLSISLLASTWVGLFAFLGANSAYGTIDKIRAEYVPNVDEFTLSLPNLSVISRVFARDGELLTELHDGRNSEPVPIGQIPENLKMAILAAEDNNFYEHKGVSFPSIALAALRTYRSGNTIGGSTITQQIVKNEFVGNEVTIERKIREAFIAAELERKFDKDQLLEYYVNSVYFGAGAYGVKAAAREFYGKDMADLTLDESATLAVLIRNPGFYDPRREPTRVVDRRNDVLDVMLDEGWITKPQAEAARARPLGVIEHKVFRGPAEHVRAEVIRQLLRDPRFAFLGDTVEERKVAVFGCPADDIVCTGGGGLVIETSLDLGLQQAATNLLQQWLPTYGYAENLELCKKIYPTTPVEQLVTVAETTSCAPTGAISMVDNHTGEVLVMASGLPFETQQFDLAIQGRRNPGSAFKVFGLVAALENGITLGNTFSGASPLRIECPSVCSSDGTNVWTVSNAGSSYGRIPLSQATYNSVNVVFAQISMLVGPETIVEVAHRMGINSELPAVPSVVLGSGSVSTLEMASAYSTFATNGVLAKPTLITRITDRTGKVIYEHRPETEQVLDPAVAAAARIPLLEVPVKGTASGAINIDRPSGGKTGTHQEYRDAWYVGFVPQYSTAVWVGYEADQIPLRNVRINGQIYKRVFGGSVPAPIWSEFMRMVLEDVEVAEFPQLSETELEPYLVPPTTVVPTLVGLDRDAAVALARQKDLNPRVVELPSLEPPGKVAFQSLSPGATVEAGLTITIYVSNGQVPSGNLPQVRGQPLEEAERIFRRFTLETGVLLKVSIVYEDVTDPAQDGKVLLQRPPRGTPVGYLDPVTLVVGRLP